MVVWCLYVDLTNTYNVLVCEKNVKLNSLYGLISYKIFICTKVYLFLYARIISENTQLKSYIIMYNIIIYIYIHTYHTHLYSLIFFCIQFFGNNNRSNHTEYIQILETVIIHSLGFSVYYMLFLIITLKIILSSYFHSKVI